MKNTFKLFGIVTSIVTIVLLIAACGDSEREFSFYGQIFNEKIKDAVRERNGIGRSIYHVDAEEVDLFELFELNNKWTYIHKDKPTDPFYVHAVYDNPENQDYPWYVDAFEAWGEEYDGKIRYWRDYHITSVYEVVHEFYARIKNDTYNGIYYWTAEGDSHYSIWFNVNRYLDSN